MLASFANYDDCLKSWTRSARRIRRHCGLCRSWRQRAMAAAASMDQRLGCSIVPVQFFEPQRHSQTFLSLGV